MFLFRSSKNFIGEPRALEGYNFSQENQKQGRLISSEVDRHVINTISDNTFGSCRVGKALHTHGAILITTIWKKELGVLSLKLASIKSKFSKPKTKTM